MKVVLIPGDGIGKEISESVKKVSEVLKTNIEWETHSAGAEYYEKSGKLFDDDLMDAIQNTGIALKGPTATPIGTGFRSINVQLRQRFSTYANLRPVHSITGVKSRYENVDLVIVRENTEDLYAGVEEKIDDNTAHSIKIITRKASERICKFAFDYAVKNDRHEVCVVTKANIMKLSDGLFLECYRNVAQNYPQIKTREILVDNLCMQLVQDPTKFDVLVLPNLYGDIVSDLTAGLIGGLGVAQGANIGNDCAVFEPVHGSAPDIKGQNKANPTALILSAVEMLRYINENSYAEKIEHALFKTLANGDKTQDLGGNLSTTDFTSKIIENL